MDNLVNSNYQQQIEVSSTLKDVFKALTKDLHLWWSKTSQSNQKKGGQFTIHFENGYWWTFKILEFTPHQEIVWKCIDGEPEFNKEWVGHLLHWKIEAHQSKVRISFHQIGLNPEIECYDVCTKTWDMFIVERLKNHLDSNTSFKN